MSGVKCVKEAAGEGAWKRLGLGDSKPVVP